MPPGDYFCCTSNGCNNSPINTNNIYVQSCLGNANTNVKCEAPFNRYCYTFSYQISGVSYNSLGCTDKCVNGYGTSQSFSGYYSCCTTSNCNILPITTVSSCFNGQSNVPCYYPKNQYCYVNYFWLTIFIQKDSESFYFYINSNFCTMYRALALLILDVLTDALAVWVFHRRR